MRIIIQWTIILLVFLFALSNCTPENTTQIPNDQCIFNPHENVTFCFDSTDSAMVKHIKEAIQNNT